jgi:alpha-beta hydrolase superfamily lysophospholipase
MGLLEQLQQIPVVDYLVLLVTALLLLLCVWGLRLARHKRLAGKASQEEVNVPDSIGTRLARAGLYVLRLAGFGVLALFVIGEVLIFIKDYAAITPDIAPAHSEVEMPDNLPFDVEKVMFPGGDNLRLAGWFVPSKNGATVILLHGYGGNRTQMLWHAERLVEAGYGVLLYDERGSGESEGDRRSLGWQDSEDVGGALAYLRSRPDVDASRIGIGGCSAGGQIALSSAARYPEIGAVLADGPGIVSVADYPPPHNWATALLIWSEFNYDLILEARLQVRRPPAIVDSIGQIAPRPVLLITAGTSIPFFGNEAWHVRHFYEHAGENTELWEIPEAYHCDGPNWQPEEYARRMLALFDEGLGSQTAD